MSRQTRWIIVVGLSAMLLSGGRAWAQNEGQDDLDKATSAKLTAQSLEDLDEVARLLQSALQKGLDEQSTEFANKLLASTMIQRGSLRANRTFRTLSAGQSWREQRRLAVADLEKALTLSPKHPQALYMVARLNLLPGGDAERAAQAVSEAVDASEDDAALRAKALTLRAGLEKDLAKKLADLDEAVRLAPGDAGALRNRGLVRADLGKFEDALADLDKALEREPRHVGTHEAKAIVLARLERYDEALISLDKARELAPSSVIPLIQKARVYIQQENANAALHELQQALAQDADNVTVLLLRAGLYEKLDKNEEALADVDRVLKLKPDLATAMRYRALLLAALDKHDEAIAAMEQLRQKNPKDLLTLLQMAMLHVSQKQHGKAIELYSAVLAEKADSLIALRGRGDSLLNTGKHAEAIRDYERAVKLQPKDPGVLNNLAWVLATSPEDRLRDGKRAVELATQACELTNHQQAHILSTLAAAYAETDDFHAAINWVQKALEVANEDQKEPLGKELETYRAGKPFRETLSEEEP